eukprot:CAMPEP_0194266296 /NCGR_PEP_ID=MMETSP0169-20130528/1251_1 /TAXON_ID=218684 /ORGANISM="Corethron pennatum, Strain L29A3" /LENGTH=315 /DNA_ID=CAMNT_0039006947 /DNA_START=93 /DNA_END=1037 /DNA_ORIENTATION=+
MSSIAADKDHELDAILDAALDELDSDSESEEGTGNPPSNAPGAADDIGCENIPSGIRTVDPAASGGGCAPDPVPRFDDATILSAMEELLSEMQLNGGAADGSGAAARTEGSADGGVPRGEDAAVDQAVERLLRGLPLGGAAGAKSSDGGTSEDAGPAGIPGMEQFGEFGEELMESFMQEFEKMGEKEDFDGVVDGMMNQLLAKDLMYEPMKQVTEKFPEWLATAKKNLPEEEYQRYGQQYQYFQRIIKVYETEPGNFQRLMELMNKIQEFGQPPADIINELAPGLEFNEEGLPIMPGAGIEGQFPVGSGMDGEQC